MSIVGVTERGEAMQGEESMNITNSLLVAILVLLLLKFYPTFIATAVSIALAASALFACYWMVARFPAWRRRRRADRIQEEQDERDFWEYNGKHEAIRSKFDPERTWNEATAVPAEYLREIRELDLRYREMLQRRNGWLARDLDEQ